ncbi:MAG: hypothetical protein ABI718_04470 [Acidobacteriota bacterium]
MQQQRVLRAWLSAALAGLLWVNLAHAQSGVKVALDEVVDDRFSEGPLRGSLQVGFTIDGKDIERVSAARIIIKEAADDRGQSLVLKGDPPDFSPRDINGGKLSVRLANPSRRSKSVNLKGAVELFVPSRDPAARVRVEKPLSQLDKPLTTKGLRAAKLNVTLLSRQKYNEKMKSQKLDATGIAEIRARGKAEGASEEEINKAIELIKALQELGGGEVPEGAVVISASSNDLDRIHRVEILGADGQPMNIVSRRTSSFGKEATMILQPSEPPSAKAVLEFQLLTDKARVLVPFDMKNVALP